LVSDIKGGTETEGPTLREDHRLRVYENRDPSRILGPKRGGENCITRNFVICIVRQYNSNDQIEEDEMGGACVTNGEKRNAYRLLVGKPEGKRPLGRPRRRWVDNIGMDFGVMGWVVCTGLDGSG
jgi:hypothetical protein